MATPPSAIPSKEEIWHTSDTRAQKLAWQSYADARCISSSDVDLMLRFQREPFLAQAACVIEDGLAYAEVFMSLLRGVTSKPECTQYVLTVLDEMMIENDQVPLIFQRILVHPALRPFAVLANLLSTCRTDEVVVSRSCNVLAHLINAGLKISADDSVLLLDWVVRDLEAGGGGTGPRKKYVLQSTIGLLQALLRDQNMKNRFVERNGIQLLGPILQSPNPNQNLQLLYQTLNSFWLLSYSDVASQRLADSTLLQSMLQLVKTVMKEKVIRMIVATWRNLMTQDAAKELLVGMGALRAVEALKSRNFADEDVVEDCQFVTENLEAVIQTKSTFDEYRKEVLSGEMEWTPVHRSVKFWEMNYNKLTDKNNQILVMLGALLKPAERPNNRTIAIACHDLGEFVRFHPKGKSVLESLGLKPLIMVLLTNSDEEVRKEALLCVQKLMVSN